MIGLALSPLTPMKNITRKVRLFRGIAKKRSDLAEAERGELRVDGDTLSMLGRGGRVGGRHQCIPLQPCVVRISLRMPCASGHSER